MANAPANIVNFFQLIGIPASDTIYIAYLLQWYVLWGLGFGIALGSYIAFTRRDFPTSTGSQARRIALVREALFWGLVTATSLILFYPRGAFKYYLILMIPFVAIFWDLSNFDLAPGITPPPDYTRVRTKIWYMLPIVIGWCIFCCVRTAYLMIPLVWLLFIMAMRHGYFKGQSLTRDNHIFKSEKISS